jgi:hypothetical protein
MMASFRAGSRPKRQTNHYAATEDFRDAFANGLSEFYPAFISSDSRSWEGRAMFGC